MILSAAFDALKRTAGDRRYLYLARTWERRPRCNVAAHRQVAGLILHNPPALRQIILRQFGWWNLWLLAGPLAQNSPLIWTALPIPERSEPRRFSCSQRRMKSSRRGSRLPVFRDNADIRNNPRIPCPFVSRAVPGALSSPHCRTDRAEHNRPAQSWPAFDSGHFVFDFAMIAPREWSVCRSIEAVPATRVLRGRIERWEGSLSRSGP